MVSFIFGDGDICCWLRFLSIKVSFLPQVLHVEEITSLCQIHNPKCNSHSTSQTVMSVTSFTHPQSQPSSLGHCMEWQEGRQNRSTPPTKSTPRIESTPLPLHKLGIEVQLYPIDARSLYTNPHLHLHVPGTQRSPTQCSEDTTTLKTLKTLKSYTQDEAPRFFGTPLKKSDERYEAGLRGQVQNLPPQCTVHPHVSPSIHEDAVAYNKRPKPKPKTQNPKKPNALCPIFTLSQKVSLQIVPKKETVPT